MKIKFTVSDSVNAKLRGYISRGIVALEVDEDGHLLITMTDGTVEDVGKVSGDDGVSCTHEWDGTVLRVTSASGTSEADLKGDRGERGLQGEQGKDGESGVYVGSDTPPASANVWIDEGADPSGTEEWTFTLQDGTVVSKTIVVID